VVVQDRAGGGDPATLRHLEIHQDHVRLDIGCHSDHLGSGRGLAHDGEVRDGAEKGAHPLAHQRVVVRDQQAEHYVWLMVGVQGRIVQRHFLIWSGR